MLDASQAYSAPESNLARAAREKATDASAHFKFPVDTPDMPDIREGAEVWAGWYDDSAGVFLPMPRPWGGFIMQSEGYAVGPTHHIQTTLSSYQVLFGRATIKGWPTGESETAIPTGGYPGGYSVADWLAGDGARTPYPGVVRQYLPNCDYSGIAPVFDTLIWTDTNKPGTPDPDWPFVGHWAFTTLDKVLQDLVGGVRSVWSNITPIYWLDAVADGAEVRPRFNFIDRADTSGPIRGRFSVDPGPGDYWIE